MLQTDLEINNVLIFVGDAVRLDKTEQRLAERGLTMKTVAASTHTPTSFASMFSGKQPTAHGIYGFFQQLEDTNHIFDLPDHTVAFDETGSNFHEWLRKDQQLFGLQEQTPLSEIEEPFVAVDRDIGGHAPYPPSLEDPKEGSRYFERSGQNLDKLKSDYDAAIDEWFDQLDRRRDILRDRGIEDDTLIIATSDHGEFLGEHGQIGHDYPAAPELVHVPTTFIHPDIEPELETEGVFRHIDLVPTLLDLLGYDQWPSLPGKNILEEELAEIGICYYNRSVNDYLRRVSPIVAGGIPTMHYEIEAVYDQDGGHSFVRSNYLTRLLVYLFRIFALPNGKYTRKNWKYSESYRAIVNTKETYGSPSFDATEAEELFDAESAGERIDRKNVELSDESVEHLSDLGYM
ncbi:sulfatase-like hydrolase/transferase [Halorubrum ezzemoulense]|uniref:Sulfatase-like hydrolase/transferase n=1 Tax=Halorubrum ezzemoulense TaxID=337243 RepID=A0ABT4Z672_HALEZ|nr:sulfatase-like hydrolase/transferase [Halorubrum ezzemoulense]MDB2293253.1 sulfatase-like hydrolase/transferase [Halorubrum ezzemoulense]